MDIKYCILLYFFYGVFGYIIEVLEILATQKKLVNRGFLLGPICPIYGTGALLITLLLDKYSNDLVVLFFMSIIICEVLEYLTSYIMEKIFLARWWDYSKRKYNINGRVCLETAIPFGLLSVLMIIIINPFVYSIFDKYSSNSLSIIILVLGVIFILDLFFSYKTIFKLRKKIKSSVKDSTEEIKKELIEFVIKENKMMQKRIFKAFPNLALLKKKVKDKIKDL